MDALFLIGEMLINPIAVYVARSKMASLIVSILPSEQKKKETKKPVGQRALRDEFMKKFGENPKDPRRKELVSNVTREMNEIQKI